MPACPVCDAGLPPTVSGRLFAHNPGRSRVVDKTVPRCEASGTRPTKGGSDGR